MKLECGSQTYLYVPFFSFTFHVVVALAAHRRDLFTPGPFRWKLWSAALSCTTIV